MEKPKLIMAKLGRIDEMNRDFDLEFWQRQSPAARMAAVWDMTVFHHKLKRRNPNELRLDRTVGHLCPREG